MNNALKQFGVLLNITDIQHFSIGDGPGIRTTVFFKGCNLHCPWCHNPETQKPEPETAFFENVKTQTVYGRLVPPEDVIKEILADDCFYRQSGGGLTVSGGECMLYPTEVQVLLSEAKKHGLHTAVDTAGCVPYTAFDAVNPYVDLYLYDIKTADAEKYGSIGGNMNVITENAKKLLLAGKQVTFRTPVIPGFNDADEELSAIADLVVKIGGTYIELLPFHRLGSGKYRALGREYTYEKEPPLSPEKVREKLDIFISRGLSAKVEA